MSIEVLLQHCWVLLMLIFQLLYQYDEIGRKIVTASHVSAREVFVLWLPHRYLICNNIFKFILWYYCWILDLFVLETGKIVVNRFLWDARFQKERTESNIKQKIVAARIYAPVSGQRQTLDIGRSAHFPLQWLLRGWRNPHLLRSFQWSIFRVDFFEFLSSCPLNFLSTEQRYHRKASYPRTQQRDQGAGWVQIQACNATMLQVYQNKLTTNYRSNLAYLVKPIVWV